MKYVDERYYTLKSNINPKTFENSKRVKNVRKDNHTIVYKLLIYYNGDVYKLRKELKYTELPISKKRRITLNIQSQTLVFTDLKSLMQSYGKILKNNKDTMCLILKCKVKDSSIDGYLNESMAVIHDGIYTFKVIKVYVNGTTYDAAFPDLNNMVLNNDIEIDKWFDNVFKFLKED